MLLWKYKRKRRRKRRLKKQQCTFLGLAITLCLEEWKIPTRFHNNTDTGPPVRFQMLSRGRCSEKRTKKNTATNLKNPTYPSSYANNISRTISCFHYICGCKNINICWTENSIGARMKFIIFRTYWQISYLKMLLKHYCCQKKQRLLLIDV